MTRGFTGWHMLATMVAFFGIIAAVNFTMARLAIGSFGGEVVENSYVASQNFNDWLDDANAQQELGWQVQAGKGEDGRVELLLGGVPADVQIAAMARQPLGVVEDMILDFEPSGEGRFLSAQTLPLGRWTLRLQLQAGDQHWRLEEDLQ